MHKICLALPTNRECADTIRLLHDEAIYGNETFGHQVVLAVIDTSSGVELEQNRQAIQQLTAHAQVAVRHFDSAQQSAFFERLFTLANPQHKTKLMELTLPASVSYGACTNRAFLLGAALRCDSVHRRDSDSHYQVFEGKTVYPIHQELLSLGKIANSVSDPSITNELKSNQLAMPVSIVAASFIGEMSVDIGEMKMLSPEIYANVVKLWAAKGTSPAHQEWLVEESFKGAGTAPYTGESATLGSVDPMLIDMCNISFFGVQEAFPLPPAKDTIGSDYFLHHLIYHSGLPGVAHNRHITNFYTPERKSDQGFIQYQRRFVKFMLSMPYLHTAYQALAAAGPQQLLTQHNKINTQAVCKILEQTLHIDNEHCYYVINEIIKNYKLLGGRYETLAELLETEKEGLITQAKDDMEDYLFLANNWSQLINLSKELRI